MARLRRGVTLVEMLMVGLIVSIIGSMAFWGLAALRVAWYNMLDTNNLVADNRQALDILSEHLRNAQSCRNGSLGILASAIHATATNSVTYYGDDATCAQVRYYVNNGVLWRTDSTGTRRVASNITGFTAQYYKSLTYHGNWTLTTDPALPTDEEKPRLAGVLLSVTSAANGQTATAANWVRFRNSPKKSRMDGT